MIRDSSCSLQLEKPRSREASAACMGPWRDKAGGQQCSLHSHNSRVTSRNVASACHLCECLLILSFKLIHQKRKYIYFKEKLFLRTDNGKPTSPGIKRVPQGKNTLMFDGKWIPAAVCCGQKARRPRKAPLCWQESVKS